MAQHHPPRSHTIRSRMRSFSCAGGRLRPVQAETSTQFGPRYVVDVLRVDVVRTMSPNSRLDLGKVFRHVSRVRPLIVEVGSGGGEALLAHAAAHPGADYLAMKVWETAIAHPVTSVRRQGLHNVRVVSTDASQLLATALPVSCASEVWVLFPDPWRRPRHRERRLATTALADSVMRVLRPGGIWHLAANWTDCAQQIHDVIEAVAALPTGLRPDVTLPYFRHDDTDVRPDLGAETAEEDSLGNDLDPGSPAGVCGGQSPRYEGQVTTCFEQQGLDTGYTIRNLTAVHTEAAWIPEQGASMLGRFEAEGQTWNHAESQPWRLREGRDDGLLYPAGRS